MLKFANSRWRFDSPGRIPRGVADEFSRLIGQIAGPGDTQSILERFKSCFASAAGSESTIWSSSVSWARTDLETYMDQAGANAPLFIEAFYEACESLRSENVDVPDLALINRILVNHEAEYEVRPPNLILRGDTGEAVEVPAKPPSLDDEARETIQKSLAASEQFFSAGQYRQAVQEVLWLLETVSTAFQGIDTGTGTVQGKYFNKIVEDLRKTNRRTTLDQVLDWLTRLHGYLSAPKGGGIRHGAHLKAGISTQAHEARLFCNLIRSYITYLIAEHERLTGHRNVLG